jgi:hypothetical protein
MAPEDASPPQGVQTAAARTVPDLLAQAATRGPSR